MKGEFKMIRHYFRRTFILSLVFGMTIFLLPCGVFAQNAPPVAGDDSYTTNVNTPLIVPAPGVLGNDTDTEGNTLTAVQVSGPTHAASFTWNPDGSFTYTPTADYTGSDSFTYKANDGAADSNIATVTITIQQAAQEVFVDIKPGSCPNPVNVKSRGVLPVAILGTSGFDVTKIDPASIRLVGVAPIRSSLEDVSTPFDSEVTSCEDCTESGPDGYMDLTLKFRTQEIVAALGEVNDEECLVLQITGNLKEDFGGDPILAEDFVRILMKGKVKSPKPPNPHKPPTN